MKRANTNLIAGRYEMIGEIARSGAGTTYKARHVLLDSLVAVTVLPEKMTRVASRLTRIQDAVRRASQLRHDHLVPVLDFGQEGRRYHVVEALSEAEPLEALLGQGPLAPADALHIARQLADALAHAHGRGVVHGALSPAHVLVEREPRPRALVSGLGIGALAWEAPAAALLPYATPERLGGKEIDARTDVFSFGLLLFALFERRPFLSGGEGEIRDLLLQGAGPLLPQFSGIVPAGVAGVVARALRRTPAERQQTMVQVREEIEACLRRLGQRSAAATVSGPVTPASTPVRRCVARVVDEAVREAGAEVGAPPAVRPAAPREVSAAPTSDLPALTRPASPESPESGPSRRASLPARLVSAATQGRRASVGGAVFVAGVLVALGWPLLPEEPPVKPEEPVAVASLAEAPAAEAPAVEESEVAVAEATAADGEQAPRTTMLEVPAAMPNVAPRIVRQQPPAAAPLAVTEGDAVTFSVRAADRDPGDQLTYTWSLDGRRTGRGPSWRFVAPAGTAGAAHTVGVQVADAAGVKAPRVSWKVDVTPRMSAVNVHEWLGRFSAALERKDLATLRLYGIATSPEAAAALRKRFPLFGPYRVAVANETIRTDGRFATVAFDLVERDRHGQERASHRESYELEKHANGFVALRAR
jgi:serine/threonine-protein kinase